MSKNIVRLTESDLHRIVKGSMNKVLHESQPSELDSNGAFTSEEDYWNEFYRNVKEANAALYRALSFCGGEMNKDVLVKNIRKAFKMTLRPHITLAKENNRSYKENIIMKKVVRLTVSGMSEVAL